MRARVSARESGGNKKIHFPSLSLQSMVSFHRIEVHKFSQITLPLTGLHHNNQMKLGLPLHIFHTSDSKYAILSLPLSVPVLSTVLPALVHPCTHFHHIICMTCYYMLLSVADINLTFYRLTIPYTVYKLFFLLILTSNIIFVASVVRSAIGLLLVLFRFRFNFFIFVILRRCFSTDLQIQTSFQFFGVFFFVQKGDGAASNEQNRIVVTWGLSSLDYSNNEKHC